MLEFLAVATILLAIVAFIIAFFSPKPSIVHGSGKKTKKKKHSGSRSGFCPVCNTDLYGAEKVHSIVFDTNDTSDRRCHINGCPHCYPLQDSLSIKRECPVCEQKLPLDAYLITRMFDRAGTKQHVHVVGCSICHKKAKATRF